ncbi:MAG: preprotein translocase subunit SecE [Planctomycetes bacterium]|nr:preprotein translocase subunit SecE [Planctomycetota bacterium]
MSYRKNQGRYARMIAFWSLALLFGYGFFNGGGLKDMVVRWMGASDSVLVESFPLLQKLTIGTLIVIALYCGLLFVLSRILNQHKLADLLIDTETEMSKVTWPGWGEVVQGTMAVTGMVVVLFLFLTAADLLLTQGMNMILLGGGGVKG